MERDRIEMEDCFLIITIPNIRDEWEQTFKLLKNIHLCEFVLYKVRKAWRRGQSTSKIRLVMERIASRSFIQVDGKATSTFPLIFERLNSKKPTVKVLD